jgi:hypothetical protein
MIASPAESSGGGTGVGDGVGIGVGVAVGIGVEVPGGVCVEESPPHAKDKTQATTASKAGSSLSPIKNPPAEDVRVMISYVESTRCVVAASAGRQR